jgi:hypothetical protein
MSDPPLKSVQVASPALKLLVSLLKFPHYRTPIDQLRLPGKMSAASRDRLCQELQQQGWVDYEVKITRFGLTAAGRTLLQLDTSVLPITPDEHWILRSCRPDTSITPGQIHPRVPRDQRQRLLSGLAQRGLIRVTQQQLGAIWLTPAGVQFLREEFVPQGHTPVLSWSMLTDYLRFMRLSTQDTDPDVATRQPLTTDDVLHMIRHLDAVHQTENYLPIFHLREKLQPPLSRLELDQALYQLQREDRIDLSTLQDVSLYPPAAIAAGIPQDIGGPLFFISVV